MSESPSESTPPASPSGDPAAAVGDEALADAPACEPLPVGWVAGGQTFLVLGGALRPAAIGLVMDELISVAALCPCGVNPRDLPGAPVEVVEYALPWWWRLRAAAVAPLAREVRKRGIHLLHALDESVAALTSVLARRAGVPYVASVHRLGLGRTVARALGDAAVVVAPGRTVADDLVSRGLCDADRVRVVLPGVHQAAAARCFSDPRYDVSIVAGGRMDDFSAFAAVLRSFAEINERNYACAFFAVGNGRAEKQLRAYADRLGLRGAMQFVDRQSPAHMAAVMRSADVYISPAPTEEVDLWALQAMASGVPVFAAHGTVGDFLTEGQTAMFFEAADAGELTIKLVSLLDDRAAARDLAANALAALRETYSPARMVASLVATYRSAVE